MCRHVYTYFLYRNYVCENSTLSYIFPFQFYILYLIGGGSGEEQESF